MEDQNSLARVEFRQIVLRNQARMDEAIAKGTVQDAKPSCPLQHYFTPIDEKFGCATYAREIFIPAGVLIIGKIHRHQHLNFITKGSVLVGTEFGKKFLEAPATFISEIGLKRVVYAITDTIWTTVHLVANVGEENLADIEDEIIAPAYADMDLIDSIDQLQIGEPSK